MEYHLRCENWQVQEQGEAHRQAELVDVVSRRQRHIRFKVEHVLLNHVWMYE